MWGIMLLFYRFSAKSRSNTKRNPSLECLAELERPVGAGDSTATCLQK
jgi:hypothetical protein